MSSQTQAQLWTCCHSPTCQQMIVNPANVAPYASLCCPTPQTLECLKICSLEQTSRACTSIQGHAFKSVYGVLQIC